MWSSACVAVGNVSRPYKEEGGSCDREKYRIKHEVDKSVDIEVITVCITESQDC